MLGVKEQYLSDEQRAALEDNSLSRSGSAFKS
jgi:hypothetical protein